MLLWIILAVFFAATTVLLVVKSKSRIINPCLTLTSAASTVISTLVALSWLHLWTITIIFWVATIIIVIAAHGRKRLPEIISTFLVIILLVNLVYPFIGQVDKNQIKTDASAATTVVEKSESVKNGAINALTAAGWTSDQYLLETTDNFDPHLDKSKGGDGSFDTIGIKTSADYVNWLKSGSDTANLSVKYLVNETGDSIADVTSEGNWIAIQSLIPFFYDGNQSYDNGTIVDLGVRDGSVGDIFFIYVSPNDSLKTVSVRGACANPQKLTPKSSNPADYKQPGDGDETDSGVGTKPKVDVIVKEVEKTPQKPELNKAEYDAGITAGYSAGYADGKNSTENGSICPDGHTTDYQSGYKAGYNTGYADGLAEKIKLEESLKDDGVQEGMPTAKP